MNRRHFLKQAGLLSLLTGLSFAPNYSFARGNKEDHFFVLLRVSGGMDVTLGLDPKTHKGLGGTDQKDIFLEYREDEIFSHNNLLLGPSAVELQKHKNDILTINGINMKRDAGHEALRDYMSSGSGDGFQPILPVLLSSRLHGGPLGVMANESILIGNEKVTTYDPSLLISTNTSNDSDAVSAMNLIASNSSLFNKTVNNFLKADDLQRSVRKKMEELNISDNKSAVFRALAETFSAGKQGHRPSYQAALNLSRLSDTPLNLDTHSNHEGDHIFRQGNVWAIVAELFDVFKSIELNGSSLFDHTTFMVVSEFSRTPFLNGSFGKDHNALTNSVLLAGKNIVGGQSIGASHVISRSENSSGQAIHIGSAIDYKTGLVDQLAKSQSSSLIFPENVVKTVANCFKSENQSSILDTFDCEIIPGVVKS